MKIPNIIEIAQAWHRSSNPTTKQKEIADERISICDPCEFREFRKLTRSFHCSACGCPIAKKIYSPKIGSEACPEGKWDR